MTTLWSADSLWKLKLQQQFGVKIKEDVSWLSLSGAFKQKWFLKPQTNWNWRQDLVNVLKMSFFCKVWAAATGDLSPAPSIRLKAGSGFSLVLLLTLSFSLAHTSLWAALHQLFVTLTEAVNTKMWRHWFNEGAMWVSEEGVWVLWRRLTSLQLLYLKHPKNIWN